VIREIENAIVEKLKAESGFVKTGYASALEILAYPKEITLDGYQLPSAGGAIYVRYVGSEAEEALWQALCTQEQSRLFEITVVSAENPEVENAHHESYDFIDLIGDALFGFVPDGCESGMVFVEDGFINEQNGVWQYAILISVKTLKTER